ncbi:cellulose-binding domain-containing protein, partial [Nocardiopsis alkaliphila]|uniref:cellulose-binding domain-containing protein n=1 Tax=Nocardiopsis alkaliphila TaxID=225762 RepID=UPI000476CE7D
MSRIHRDASPGTSRTRKSAAILSGCAIGAALTFVPLTSANAATGCSVDYTIANDWGSGFTAQVEITNHGADIDHWTLEWDFSGNQQVGNAWNASVTQSGQSVSVTGAGHNASISTDGTVGFGFNGDYSGDNAAPEAFSLNGVLCEGAVDPGDDDDDDDDNGQEPAEPGERVDNPYVGADVYVNP